MGKETTIKVGPQTASSAGKCADSLDCHISQPHQFSITKKDKRLRNELRMKSVANLIKKLIQTTLHRPGALLRGWHAPLSLTLGKATLQLRRKNVGCIIRVLSDRFAAAGWQPLKSLFH